MLVGSLGKAAGWRCLGGYILTTPGCENIHAGFNSFLYLIECS